MHIWQSILAAVGLKQGGEMTSADYEFMKYVTEYGKHYGTKEEFDFRAEIFKKNLALVEEHNSRNEETHVLGINHMSDWTGDEYKALLGYRPELKAQSNAEPELLPEDDLAAELNWVTQGAVTGVKNQGQCGSCWAFSSTGAIEGAEFLHGTKQLTSLSEQNLVDCSKKNSACQGGLMDYAFEYVMESPLMAEADYPYTGTHHLWTRCKYEKSKGVGRVGGYKDVQANSAAQLKAALAHGPVSVAIEADQSVFQSYRSGVLTSAACGTKLDHGVLAVGYGTENGQAYFLVKNSWGASWGDNGYVKIGQNNVCGILQQASYPTE